MEFEWDESKRKVNIRKHGIDFVRLSTVFDGYTVTVEDARFAYGEPRFVSIGILEGRAVVIVHTERGDKIRIISARKATANEEISYFDQIADRLGASRRTNRRRN